jgi:hypothetical protein
MKRAFLLIVVPALLVALGFAQTPAASVNADQTNIKGCLGGSDGNYTVVEDNTGHIFKITTSSVDLKPHLSHDVTLIGHRASGASSAAADNSFAVAELNMISEHCAAAAAPAATVSTPSETAVTPVAAAAAPAATVSIPSETAVTPAAAAAAPAATVTTPAETPVTPAADATAPAATVTTPAETVVAPAAAATPPAATVTTPAETAIAPAPDAAAPVATVSTLAETASAPAARPRRRSATPAAAAAPAVTHSSSSETASTPAAAAVTPVATDSSSSEPVSTPAALATTPTATSMGWSTWLLIAFGVLVVAIGTMFPFLSRWRKRKSLERTGAPNLSFTREANSGQGRVEQGKSAPPVTRKAA